MLLFANKRDRVQLTAATARQNSRRTNQNLGDFFMPVDNSMTSKTAESAAKQATAYETPRFERHDLRVVTLGGSPGSGDSGDPNQQLVPGSPNGEREEKGFEEDWDNGG